MPKTELAFARLDYPLLPGPTAVSEPTIEFNVRSSESSSSTSPALVPPALIARADSEPRLETSSASIAIPPVPTESPTKLEPQPEAASVVDNAEPEASESAPAGLESWRLPQPGALAARRTTIAGWTSAGLSLSSHDAVDRYNGVVGFNDRDGEAQVNQMYVFLEREAVTDDRDWDIGGRVDFLYGTDGRFAQAFDGLEADWDQTARFYQAALPQFYADVAFRDWTMRAGHFYTILGYEVVPAPQNFFYSHSYALLYGEPITHTGVLLIRDIQDRIKLIAGLHRGNDQVNDTDGRNAVNFLGGVTWTSEDQRASAAFGLTSGEQGRGIRQTIYSLVGTLKLTERLRYVLQHDYGWTSTDQSSPLEGQWYGLDQYLFYDLTETCAAGMRFEWFRDDDGTRVRGLGSGNLNQGPFAGNFYELTAGLNWHPTVNLLVRPELRWDWYHSSVAGGPLPFDAGRANDQLLLGCDVIVTY